MVCRFPGGRHGHRPFMTVKSQFDAESWATVVEGPALAGLAVVAADRGGTIRESMSLAHAYAEAQKEGFGELVEQIVNSAPALKAPQVEDRAELMAFATGRLREAAAIVGRTADPDELEDYRRFVLDVADTVSRAHKEGGFLGIGGTPVSEKERAALHEIAVAVGMHAA